MARGPTEPLSRAFLITIPRPAHRIGNFHFAFPATGQYTPIRLRSRSFYIGSKAKAPVVRDTALAGTKKAMICPIPQRFLGHFSLNFPPSSRLVSPGCRAYPAGSGKARIRPSMLPNKRRVRWLSANSSQ